MNGRLYKSREDKMILGVCGGVAKYMGIDSSLIRIIWAVASFIYGTGLLLYLLAAFILPYNENEAFEQNESHEQNTGRNQEHNKVIAIILILSGLFLLLRRFTVFFSVEYFWPGLLIVLGVLLIVKGKDKKHEE